jgi:hypothetical protein
LGATQFDQWSDILANMPSSSGPRAIGPKTLWIDSTLAPGGIAVVPAGSYNFEGPTTWRGIINVGANLSFDADVRLVGLDAMTFEDLNITAKNTVFPVIEIAGAMTRRDVRIINTVINNSAGTKPFVDVSNLAQAAVILRGSSGIGGGAAGSEAVKVAVNCLVNIEAYDQAIISQFALDFDAAAGPGNVFLDGAARLSYTQTWPSFAPDLPGSIPSLITEGSYRQSFTNADLSLVGVLSVFHRLSETYCNVSVYDAAGRMLTPALVAALNTPIIRRLDENNLEVDFGAPVIPGGDIYHVIVRR